MLGLMCFEAVECSDWAVVALRCVPYDRHARELAE